MKYQLYGSNHISLLSVKTYTMATKTSTSDGSDPTKYTWRSRLSATLVNPGSKLARRPGELPRTQTRGEHFKAATLKTVW